MSAEDKPMLRSWRFINLAKGCDQLFVSNQIRTSRYSTITFLPKSLFEQFQKAAYIWFLLVSAIELSPGNVEVERKWSTIAPLLCLLAVTMVKDAYLDLKRHRSDNDINSQTYAVWNGSDFTPTVSRDIQVGDFLFLQDRTLVPADVLVLASGHIDHICYVDKQHFHGNSNVSMKAAIKETQEVINTLSSDEAMLMMRDLRGVVKIGEPNPDFHKLNAYIKMPRTPKSVPIPIDHFIVRQSVIHATPWIIALVVYTGLETKAYLNISAAKKKVGHLDRTLSRWVTVILSCLLMVVLVLSLCSRFLSKSNDSFLTVFLNYLLLLHEAVPITLFLTVEIVRVCQAYFMQVDVHLDGKVEFKTADINEELGQIEYVFASKTAIIASNRPELRVLIIGEDEFTAFPEPQPIPPIDSLSQRKANRITSRDFDREGLTTDTFAQLISEDVQYLSLEDQTFKRLQEICATNRPANYEDFFECVTLCNEVDITENHSFFSSWKEDELLVSKARYFGCVLESRLETECRVNLFGRPTLYEVIAYSPYTKESRLTRIFVQRADEPNFAVYYVKGPLSTMANIVDSSMTEFKKIEKQVSGLNKRGIRTQILAKRMVVDEELTVLKEKFRAAKLAVSDIDQAINDVFQEIEYQQEVVFLGIIGIADSVAAETKETIATCQKAGVKVWMLSGDSESSTLSAAYQAGLVEAEQPVCHFKGMVNVDMLQEELEMSIRQYIVQETEFEGFLRGNSFGSEEATITKSKTLTREFTILQRIHGSAHTKQVKDISDASYDPEKLNFVVSIDGVTFLSAMSDKVCKRLLCYLLFCANAVCCSNFLPFQKGLAVKLVKENFSFRPVTLAISCTGNSIAMLQESDVGISLQGKDSYSSHVSDIMIHSFSLLTPLLFKHGQWNYVRMSKAVLLFLHRSMLLNVMLVCFSLVNDFTVYELFNTLQLVLTLYFLAELPLVFFAIFDQHIAPEEIPKVLTTYQDGQLQRMFTLSDLLYYCLLAVVQGLLLCAFLYSACTAVLSSHGHTQTLGTVCLLMLLTFVLTTNIQTCISSNNFTWLFAGVYTFSCAMIIMFLVIVNFLSDSELYGVLSEVFASGVLITVMFLGPMVCFLVGYATRAYSRVFHPTAVEKLRTGKIGGSERKSAKAFSRISAFAKSLKAIYRSTATAEAQGDDNAYAIRPFSLHFASKYIESEYQMKYITSNVKLIRGIMLAGLCTVLIWLVIDSTTHSFEEWYLILRLALCGCALLLFAVTFSKWFKRNHSKVTIAVMLGAIILINATETARGKEGMAISGLASVSICIVNYVDFEWVVIANGLNLGLFALNLIYFFQDRDSAMAVIQILNGLALLIGIIVVSGIVGYMLQKTNRIGYKLRYSTEKEVEKSRHILSLLLPPFVLNQVVARQDDKYIAEDQGIVTVVFCDIYDFDSLCELYRPQELVEFLDLVFQKFDDLCSLYGVAKIETVGKTYMACAGLKSVEKCLASGIAAIPHPTRAINFALSIIQALSTIQLKNSRNLQVKIGINSGPVISGVVGNHKPQFSLVGDTVNTASRMCSTIETVNTIQVSEETKEMISDAAGLTFQAKTVWAKGKGDMMTYIVSRESTIAVHQGSEEPAPRRRTVMSTVANAVLAKGTFAPDSLGTSASIRKLPKSIPFAFYPFLNHRLSEENEMFIHEAERNNQVLLTYGSLVGLCLHSFLAFLRAIEYFYYPDYSTGKTTIAYLALSVLFLCATVAPKKVLMLRSSALACIVAYLACVALILLDFVDHTNYHMDFVVMDFLFFQVVMTWSGLLFSKAAMVVSAIYLAEWLAAITFVDDKYMHAMYVFFLLFHAVMNCSSFVARERKLRKNFHLKRVQEKEIGRNEKLLKNMMPKIVYERLKQDVVATDRYRSVTLLFADIVGFTNWSSDKTPQQVVGMLSALFTQFDNLCLKFKSYKVHTIGDCYVVMGYSGESEERDPAMECLRVFGMGHAMIGVIQEVNRQEEISLNMRIGIHTGDVIAGITGKDIVRYDIYGPTVLVANKMESNGTAGKVNVSAVTREILERVAQGILQYEDNKEVVAHSIGKSFMSYFVSVSDENRLGRLVAE